MTSNTDPIAEKLKKAKVRAEEEQIAATGEQLMARDFKTFARAGGPAEFNKLREALRERAQAINAADPSANFRFVEAAEPRVEARKYAAVLELYQGAEQFKVTLRVGLHPNAHQFMDETPEVKSQAWAFTAASDENGFYWSDGEGERWTEDAIANAALDALSDFVVADYQP